MVFISSATAAAAAVGIFFLASGVSITGVAGHPMVKRSSNTNIVSVFSGLCLDDTNGSTSNGQTMQQWACTSGNNNQQWTINAAGGGYYQIVNQNSGLCLDNNASTTNGTTVIQWQCYSGSANQLWSLPLQSDGSYAIQSQKSGYCVDVRDYSTANGGAIQQWSCTYSTNQRWKLSLSSGTTTTSTKTPTTTTTTTTKASPTPVQTSFNFGTTKMRGVNLGGWLVLEKWIVPSFFANNAPNAVDEWTFSQTLGQSAALAALTQHWDTWVTESDIQTLASYGLNFLRIPIGYWALDVSGGEPYVSGPQIGYLKQAVTWAAKYGLYVIVDLHGAPGSQNGFDNSGVQGSIGWTNGGFSGSNVQRTLKVINQLADIFSASPYGSTVLSIELLNEPANWGIDMNVLKQYYTTSYANIVASESAPEVIMIHDAFEGLGSYWNGFMQPPNYQNVVMDTHQYQAFDSSMQGWSAQQHLDYTCSLKSGIVASNSNLWTVTGEWSLGTYSYGVSQTGGQSYTQWPASYKSFLRQFIELQMDVYEAGSGWVFWNFKIETGYEEWNYMLGVQQGWIPNPPTDRTHTC